MANEIDIDNIISTLTHGENTTEVEIDAPFEELMKVFEKINDKNVIEEYSSIINGMANQVDRFFTSYGIEIKRSEITQLLDKKFSKENYLGVLRNTIKEIAKKNNLKVVKKRN